MKNFNLKYNGTVPYITGDRMYAVDVLRDHRALQARAGQVLSDIVESVPILLSGGVVTQGGGANLDITTGYGYALHEVDVPDDFSTQPPGITQEDIPIRVYWAAQTNINASSSNCSVYDITDDGATVHYVKMRYLETDGNTRARAKASGTYSYETIPEFDLQVDDTAPTDYDILLATFTSSGGTYTFTSQKTHGVYISGLKTETGSFYVSTQAQFDAIIEEVSGNQWQFVDDVTSVVFDNLSGGYQMDDDDDYLETNNCKSIEMRGGAFLDFNAGIGYIKINTDDCYLKNVHVQGNGSVGAVTQSFYLEASRVTFDSCKCSNRSSNTDMNGFNGYGVGTELHRVTSKYINCVVFNLNSSGSDPIRGFYFGFNMSGCIVHNLDSSSGSGQCTGFHSCYNVSSCSVYTLNSDSGNIWGFNQSYNLSSCYVDTVDSISGAAYGIANCQAISTCYVRDIDSDSGNAYGFDDCEYCSSCIAADIDSGSATAEGFHDCEYCSSIWTTEAINSGNDWIDTVDAQITNKVSTPSVFT